MIIKILQKLQITISWKLLFIGLCDNAIQTTEIIDYAAECVETGENRMELYEITGAYPDDFDYVLNLVQDMQEETFSEEFERRKIRLAIVYDTIKEKNHSFIDGLVELTELWEKLGFPDDSPHIVQGRGNSILPSDYYTQENYDFLFKANCEWFKKELVLLRKN